MSKRKLSRRQAWRIDKIQQERAARAEKRAGHINVAASDINDSSLVGPEQEGLVIAHYGTQVAIEAIDNPSVSRRCYLRANLGSLVTGDRVIWRDGDPQGVVVAVSERTNALARPDPHGDMKTIAANIDTLLIVVAPLPKPHSHLIDRYLVAAESNDITPAIVLNKSDLIDDGNRDTIHTICELYRSLNYTVIEASTTQGNGLDTLAEFLRDKTSVFVGQSGVGKSSLINKLLPNSNLRVGGLSEANQKGTHTTTTAELFHFPMGGQLIDSPGIREFGLWHMDEATIMEGFIELRPFIGHCKFRNCKHQQEPNCAILNAYEEGHICEQRMSSYIALREAIENDTY